MFTNINVYRKEKDGTKRIDESMSESDLGKSDKLCYGLSGLLK